MAITDEIAPTLLIGVGGTGSGIAHAVYNQVVASGLESNRIRAMAFDTDEKDQRDLRNLGRVSGGKPTDTIRFSTVDTIESLLDRYPDIEEDWFVVPRKTIPMGIRQMNLLKGAGQIRMLTRLALTDALRNGSIESAIGGAIAEIMRHDNQTTPVNHINVLLVGSLAGATGSGSFLQLACLLADIAEAKNISVTTRGLFLMPDVYVNTGLPRDQVPNVLANGYASFKEFHAVTLRGADLAGKFDFDFRYAPGRHLSVGDIPFASLTIIDYEDTKGGNLGRSIESYKRLAEKAAFTMLFTPVGGAVDSTTVNDARAEVAASGRGTHNRIAAIGVSSLQYPHAEIVEYLTKQVAREVLSGDWLRLDRQFRSRMQQYKSQKEAGNVSIQEPSQGRAYLEDLRQLATNDRFPFFIEILDGLNPTKRDEYGNEVAQPQPEAYLEALEEHLKSSFWGAEDLVETAKRKNADEGQFASKEALVEEIRRRESRLDDDFRRVEQSLSSRPLDILSNLFAVADDLGDQDWRPHHLQYHLVGQGTHPVQSRAFLFALRDLIDARLEALSGDDQRKTYLKLANVFRSDEEETGNPGTRGSPNIVKTANEAAQQNALIQFFNGGTKDFVNSYVTYYNASTRKLVDYGNTRLLERALDRLAQEVDEQIRVLNGLFLEIENLLESLDREVNEHERKHETTQFSGTTLYVCADGPSKQALWQETLTAMIGQRLDKDINKEITKASYAMSRRNRNARRPEGLDRLRSMFKDTVMTGYCKRLVEEDFTSIHNKTVVQALVFEAENSDVAPSALFRDRIDVVRKQAQPMVTLTNPAAGQEVQYWSYSSHIRDDMGPVGNLDDFLSPSGDGIRQIEEPGIPPTEIMCVTITVDLEISHLAKLSPPSQNTNSVAPDRAGKYYREYQMMVNELIEAAAVNDTPNTITPHIHRDWHKPGLLPEISDQITKKLTAELNKGLVAAIALDALSFEVRHGKAVTEVKTLGRVRSDGVHVTICDSHDMFEVVKAFGLRPEAIRACLRLWDEKLEEVATQSEKNIALEEIADSGVVEKILMVSGVRRDTEIRDNKVTNLIEGHCNLLANANEIAYPSLPISAVQEKTETLIATTRNTAFSSLTPNLDSEAISVLESLHARGVEQWRKSL
jgi:hypothetical protein